PDDPQMLWTRVGIAGWRGDYAEAERFARALGAATTSSQFFQGITNQNLALLAGAQGKIAEAEQEFRTGAGLHEARGARDMYVYQMAQLAQFDLHYRNRPADALAILTEALAKHPLASIAPYDRPYSQVAIT